MQDEIEHKMVTLSVSTAKFTGKVFYACLEKHMNDLTNPQGKQSLRNLKKKGHGLDKVDLPKDEIKDFKKAARKYGVDFSITKEKEGTPPMYHIHFKAKDDSAINSAISDALANRVKKQTRKPLLERLQDKKEKVVNLAEKSLEKVQKIAKKVISR